MNSSGSAMAENAKWMDSIAGKSEQLSNNMQTMWESTLNSEVIKYFYDLAIGATDLIKEIGLIGPALAGVLVYFTAFKKQNLFIVFKDLQTNMQSYIHSIKALQTVQASTGNVKTMSLMDFNAGPVNQYAAAVSNLSAKQQAATLSAFGLNAEQIRAAMTANHVTDENIRLALSEAQVSQARVTNTNLTGALIATTLQQKGVTLSQNAANFLLAHSTEEITKKMLAQAVAKGDLTHQDVILILKSGMVTSANYAQAFSWKALGNAIKVAFLSNPIGWILGIVTAVTALLPLLNDWIDKTEEVSKASEDALNKYKETTDSLKESKKTINEISSDYEKLAMGVDELGNNISLSTSEYERYNDIVNKIADMFPTMVRGYTAEGNAIIKNKGSVEALTQAYAELQEAANMDLVLDGKNILSNYQNIVTGSSWLSTESSRDIEAARELQKILSDQESYNFSVFNGSDSPERRRADRILTMLQEAGIERNSSEDNAEYVQRAIQEFPAIAQGIVNSWNATVNAAVSQVQPLVNAYLNTSIGYAGLTTEQKNIIDTVASNLNEEFFNSFDGDVSQMYAKLEEIMLNVKSAGLDDDFSTTIGMQTKFNNGEATYDEYIAQINSFYAVLKTLQEQGYLDEEVVTSLKVFFDTSSYETQLNTAKKLLDDQGDLAAGTLTKADLAIVDQYADEWLDLYGAQIPLQKLIELIHEAREAAGEFSVSGMIDDFDTLQSAFSKLGDAYEVFEEHGIVTAETLADIQESFGNLEGFDDFITVLGDSSSSMDDVKAALNGLATAYLNSSGVLNNLTEENEQFIISQLKAFGVVNAEEYIAGIRSVQEAMATEYGIDLSNYATVEGMKQAISADLYASIVAIEDDKVADLAKKYGIDLENFGSAEEAKTAIAIAEARKRAEADYRTAESKAKLDAMSKRDATTVQDGDINTKGFLGIGKNKLSGMSYTEVKNAYNNGEYDGKSWKSNVKSWLDQVESAATAEYEAASSAAYDIYQEAIAGIDDVEAKYAALDEYVAKYQPTLSFDPSQFGGPGSSDSGSSSSSEFEKTIDFIEIRLEELTEKIDKYKAKLDNALDYASKNNIIDSIISVNKSKISDMQKGIQAYGTYIASFLSSIPEQYRAMAANGAIAVRDFAGDASEEVVEAIEKYREYLQKIADLEQQIEEMQTENRDWEFEQIANAQHSGEVRADIEDKQTDKLQWAVDYDEDRGLITDPAYYAAMMENSERTIDYLTTARAKMQEEFNDAMSKGLFTNADGSNNDLFYEEIAKLYDMDARIDEAVASLEEFQNAINDIYWEGFDELIARFDYISEETQGLIDLMSELDMVSKPDNNNGWSADDVEWTKEGLASLGLHAQEMERAEEKAKAYAIAIDDLTAEYQAGHYSESEYHEKLNELTQGQYDAIKAAREEKEAIVDLQKSRIDAIKEGIEKEIEAYEELIDKKKEELSAEKDLYDFQKGVQNQQKDIAAIQRKLAALSADNSASAVAQRKKLEAELAEANAALEETYYDRSVENKQNALDQELEDFKTEKEAEIEQWEQWLENIEAVVTESLGIVKSNADDIGQTLTEKATEYNLTVSDAVLNPWKDGALAIDDYTTKFGDSVSSTTEQLETIRSKWQEIKEELAAANAVADEYFAKAKENHSLDNPSVADINKENANYAAAHKTSTSTPTVNTNTNNNTNANQNKGTPAIGGSVKVKSTATHYGSKSGNVKMASFVPGGTYTAYKTSGDQVLIGLNGAYTGWVNIKDLEGYASGTTSLKKSGLVTVDELGEELILGAHNGRLTYVEKGTGIVPADITSNLMAWGELNPQDMLDRNRPSIAPSKSIVNTEINIDNSIGELIHIDKCSTETIPDIEKIVNNALDKHTQKLNQSLRKFTR